MNSRAWLNLGLVMLLAALSLVAWFKPGQPPPAESRLVNLDPDSIDRIRVQLPRQPVIRIERRAGQWQVTAPMDVPANEVRVGALLNLAIKTSDTHYNARKLNLARYGLGTPLVTVTLNDQRLAFGDINTVDYRRYVRAGDTVYLISDDLQDLETADVAAYVAPKLIPAGSEIRALGLPQVKLKRAEDGRWKSSPDKLSPTGIEALLNAWEEAQAYQVTLYNGKQNKRSPINVTVTLADGQQLSFEATTSKTELVLARPDLNIEYHLPVDAAGGLLHL